MWTFILSGCISVTLIMSFVLCLCWRKKSPKNDLLGLDGMVIQKNPDENVNHLPSAASCVVDKTDFMGPNADINESSRRSVAANNTRRSLPDIPSEQDNILHWEPAGDNSSEHYATVGQFQNAKRHTVPNGVDARLSFSQHSSISQPDDSTSTYEKVKYDKIKSSEHPYAQLQPTTGRHAGTFEDKLNCDERANLLRPDGASTSAEPAAPPRSRRSSAQSSLGVDIPAASAVAGVLAASPELPYMTPPVTQTNFSGDSQDSSRGGYSSISVREPLATIRAQTKELNKRRDLDQHYSTVSDDSDDVYTTIPDPNNQIYNSESETYARIPAHPVTVEAEVNAPPSSSMESSPSPQPPPPSVNSLKQVAGHSHSRQASSSSSIANIGSPKPEKRQANSPLPLPPSETSEYPQAQRNVDDLYAKVQKNRKKEELETERAPEKGKGNDDNISRKSESSCSSSDDRQFQEPHREHNYETLRKTKLDRTDSGYEKIRNDEPGYASINGPESITSSDPGYEVLKQKSLSESDPNYEELPSSSNSDAGYSKIKDNSVTDGYSVVNKNNKNDEKSRTSGSYSNSQDFSLDEPNYESMPSESLSSEHNYAALKSTTGSESDPNYESVNHTDVNYESVRKLEDPPYEKLNEFYSNKVRGLGYENIDSSESSNDTSDTQFQQPNNDTDAETPGYERIQRNGNNSSNLESTSGKNESNYSPVQKRTQKGLRVGKYRSLLEKVLDFKHSYIMRFMQVSFPTNYSYGIIMFLKIRFNRSFPSRKSFNNS